jgi:hypothetical protein
MKTPPVQTDSWDLGNYLNKRIKVVMPGKLDDSISMEGLLLEDNARGIFVKVASEVIFIPFTSFSYIKFL